MVIQKRQKFESTYNSLISPHVKTFALISIRCRWNAAPFQTIKSIQYLKLYGNETISHQLLSNKLNTTEIDFNFSWNSIYYDVTPDSSLNQLNIIACMKQSIALQQKTSCICKHCKFFYWEISLTLNISPKTIADWLIDFRMTNCYKGSVNLQTVFYLSHSRTCHVHWHRHAQSITHQTVFPW